MKKFLIFIAVVVFVVVGYLVVDTLLYTGFKPKEVRENSLYADFYAKDGVSDTTAVVLLGGGQWGAYWGEQIANAGCVALTLPYANRVGLPRLPEEIPLEYFEKAFRYLQAQPEVGKGKIIVMGASRNAELALLLAATFPQYISGVIAYSPSSVNWSNRVLTYNSEELKASYTYNGEDIPSVPMEKFSPEAFPEDTVATLPYWQDGLKKAHDLPETHIPVENINGPVLLLAGKDDEVWPSYTMAKQIVDRLFEHDFKHPIQLIAYEDAGHLISGDPSHFTLVRVGTLRINAIDYRYAYGGSADGDYTAKQDAYSKVFEFIEQINAL